MRLSSPRLQLVRYQKIIHEPRNVCVIGCCVIFIAAGIRSEPEPATLSQWEKWWFAAVEDGLVHTLSHAWSSLPFPNGVDHRSIAGHSAEDATSVAVSRHERLQGETALHCAIRNGQTRVALWLIENAEASPIQSYEVFALPLKELTSIRHRSTA